jgi:hypothetical protein
MNCTFFLDINIFTNKLLDSRSLSQPCEGELQVKLWLLFAASGICLLTITSNVAFGQCTDRTDYTSGGCASSPDCTRACNLQYDPSGTSKPRANSFPIWEQKPPVQAEATHPSNARIIGIWLGFSAFLLGCQFLLYRWRNRRPLTSAIGASLVQRGWS